MRFLTFLLMLLCATSVLAAPQLDARLSQYQIGMGETLDLSITLSQPTANVTTEPDISELHNDFTIYNHNTSHSTQIINGQRSQEITWIYKIEPLRRGEITIPAIRLKTATGTLSTQPLKLQVTQAGAPRQDGTELQVEVSNPKPYLYEPVHITLRLTHIGDLRNPEPMMPNNGVVVEQLTNMSATKQVINGRTVIVHEIEYLLTPMQSGTIDLGIIRMRASKLDNNNRNGQFGGLFSFNAYRQVTVTAKPISLEVQMPSATQAPHWLPLLNLNAEATWETDVEQAVTVGVPLIRTFKIVAAGMGGQPFPNLEQLMTGNDQFRVRYSKPETERKLLSNTRIPATYITQTLSVIPLQVGQMSIPALRIPWWDVNEQKMAWTEIPAQTLMVQANPNALPTTPVTQLDSIQQPVSSQPSVVHVQQHFSLLQLNLLGLSVIALIIALLQSWLKQRCVTKPVTPSEPSHTLSTKQLKQQFTNALTPQQVQTLMQQYAHEQWQLPKNAALTQIGRTMQQQLTQGEQLADLLKILEQGLYAAQADFDLAEWKQQWFKAWQQARPKPKTTETIPTRIGTLNPI